MKRQENNVFKFKQRCLKCSHIMTIEIKQKKDKPLIKPEKYTCEQCEHKGKFGEAPKPPKPINFQGVSDQNMPPVLDNEGNPCLVVNGKRLPFTLGRIELLKKEIAIKMAQLDSLEKLWAKENLETKEK